MREREELAPCAGCFKKNRPSMKPVDSFSKGRNALGLSSICNDCKAETATAKRFASAKYMNRLNAKYRWLTAKAVDMNIYAGANIYCTRGRHVVDLIDVTYCTIRWVSRTSSYSGMCKACRSEMHRDRRLRRDDRDSWLRGKLERGWLGPRPGDEDPQ